MKLKIILPLLLLALPAFIFAQEPGKRDHFIEVTGTAELEVEPNEIYVVVRLREFEEARQKVLLEKLDKDFLDAFDATGLNRNQLVLADAGVQLGRLTRRQKDAFREKTYQVKLTSASQLEKFIDKVESVKIDYADIERLHHSELEKMKLDLKVKALQIAKAKAEALVKGIDSALGKPIHIQEVPFAPIFQPGNVRYEYQSNARFSGAVERSAPQGLESGIAFKKIKLQAQVIAQFEIK